MISSVYWGLRVFLDEQRGTDDFVPEAPPAAPGVTKNNAKKE
jgi:hypothetical protein